MAVYSQGQVGNITTYLGTNSTYLCSMAELCSVQTLTIASGRNATVTVTATSGYIAASRTYTKYIVALLSLLVAFADTIRLGVIYFRSKNKPGKMAPYNEEGITNSKAMK